MLSSTEIGSDFKFVMGIYLITNVTIISMLITTLGVKLIKSLYKKVSSSYESETKDEFY